MDGAEVDGAKMKHDPIFSRLKRLYCCVRQEVVFGILIF